MGSLALFATILLLVASFVTASQDVCSLPKKTGRYIAYLPRIYYDSVTGTCKSFIYGGSEGNANNFNTIGECQRKCDADICSLPRQPGTCKAYIPRFYYDSVAGACKSFIYGGCHGNANNFQTNEGCQKSCVYTGGVVCSLPRKQGPCQGSFPRFYYDSVFGTCKPFIYGGCVGNANNFQTVSECQISCVSTGGDVCSLPIDRGPCRSIFPRYYYDSVFGTCKPFSYGGCQGNANNFKSIGDCQSSCVSTGGDVCSLPIQPGPCKGSFPKFYYDSVFGTCKPFIYGGCQGNANNFQTIGGCQSSCGQNSGICTLPKKIGPCTMAVPRFYFDSIIGTCKPFSFGGCHGNANNFQTIGECQSSCGGDVCSLTSRLGPCLDLFPRFYFDSVTGTCKLFTYGGCKGNANNFQTIEECTRSCGCLLPKKPGPCRAHMPHFYYNAQQGTCLRFIYGGCAANANIFEFKRDCLRTCA